MNSFLVIVSYYLLVMKSLQQNTRGHCFTTLTAELKILEQISDMGVSYYDRHSAAQPPHGKLVP